jgi:hypothetical protein
MKTTAITITTRAKNNYLGCKVGEFVQVCGSRGDGAHMLQIANTIASAERLAGVQARLVPGREGHMVRCRTYSRDAGYLCGRATGEYYVEVEIVAA